MFYTFLTFLFIISGTPVCSSQLSGKKYVRVVYLQSDSTKRTDFEKYDIDLIPKEYVTHIIYAFASLNRTTYEDIVLNNKDQLKRVLRYQQYGIKCMIGFGGWGDSFNDYPKMLNVEEKRNRFAENAAKFVAENGLDGFDMDLEYPCCWRGNCDYHCSDDRVNFTRLMEMIRKHLDQLGELYGKRFLLTAAVSPFVHNIPIIYEVKKLNSLLDYIHVMTYELHNAYSGRLGNAAPFTAQGNDRNSRELNVIFIMDKWLNYGASPEKLTIGIPFFSKSFRLFRQDLHCTGDLALGTSSIGDPAFLKTVDIISSEPNWEVTTAAYGTYATKDLIWVSYDDVQNVVDKARYVIEKKFAGIMVWSVDQDYFYDGPCGKYPLLSAIHHALNGSKRKFENCTAKFSNTTQQSCSK